MADPPWELKMADPVAENPPRGRHTRYRHRSLGGNSDNSSETPQLPVQVPGHRPPHHFPSLTVVFEEEGPLDSGEESTSSSAWNLAMPKSSALSISVPQADLNEPGLKSPQTPHHSPTGLGRRRIKYEGHSGTASPDLSALPPLPQSPDSPQSSHTSQSATARQELPKFGRGRMLAHRPGRKPVPPAAASSTNLDPMSSTRRLYHETSGSSMASASHGNLLETSSLRSGGTFYDEPTPTHPISIKKNGIDHSEIADVEVKSNSVPQVEAENMTQKKPGRPARLDRFLGRRPSIRQDSVDIRPIKPKTRDGFLEPGSTTKRAQESPRTAPLEHERSFRDLMGSAIRNKSADRTTVDSQGDGEIHTKQSTSRGDNRFISNLKMSSNKAADGIERARKGIMGKFNRSGSHGESTYLTDEHYVLRNINQPLVEQTRRTRIRNRMEDAKDKTEFWMPALPYRCIDYLNLKGIEEEGLYRVPGSGREIKYWQRRFDIEGDVNLLDEPELYDINIVGSMLKAWLRELPDQLFPHGAQEAVLSQSDTQAVDPPQTLRDQLSNLPPQNYYLLFAVTCHIALLYGHSHSNKMGFNNLVVCFQPCLGIEGAIFKWLVCKWKQCWQGCNTEKEYLAEEYRVLEATRHASAGRSEAPSSQTYDEKAIYSNPSSRAGTTGPQSTPPRSRRPSLASSQSRNDFIKEEVSPIPSSALGGRATPDQPPPSLEPVGSVSPMRM